MWQCPKCRESVVGSFEVCWNCGTSRDGQEDPSFQKADDIAVERGPPSPAPSAPFVQPKLVPEPDTRKTHSTPCAKCGSNRIMRDVLVLDRSEGNSREALSAQIDRNPDAWLFKGRVVVDIHAHICGECGHVELQAASPEQLWAAYSAQRDDASNNPARRPEE